MKQRTTLEEMNEHVELADFNALASDSEKEERLDSALQCALEILNDQLEETWVALRGELEEARGTMYIYALIADSWYMLPLYAVEVEGENGGYAVCSFVPSAHLMLSHLAQTAPRRDLIACARNEAPVNILVIFAIAPPVSATMTREELIETCVHTVTQDTSLEELGPWGAGVQNLYVVKRLEALEGEEVKWSTESVNNVEH
jgi:hypothetical protein